MDEARKPPDKTPAQSRHSTPEGRRRFLKTGTAAAPVLLTIVSRPVLGGVCLTTSAFISMNASPGHANTYVTCDGQDPESWTNNLDNWPNPYIGKTVVDTPIQGLTDNDSEHGPLLGAASLQSFDAASAPKTGASLQFDAASSPKPGSIIELATPFHSSTTGFHGTYFAGKSMAEVLQGPDQGRGGLAKYCAAALLNAAAGLTPVLSETAVRNLWNEIDARGYFEPVAGVRWYDDDVIEYLRSTFR